MKGTKKLFAILTLLILVLGFLPLLAQPLPYEGHDWLEYEATMYYGDAFEPDDTRFQAKACPVNGPLQLRNFHVQADPDWIWFNAQLGVSYAIEAVGRPIAPRNCRRFICSLTIAIPYMHKSSNHPPNEPAAPTHTIVSHSRGDFQRFPDLGQCRMVTRSGANC